MLHGASDTHTLTVEVLAVDEQVEHVVALAAHLWQRAGGR